MIDCTFEFFYREKNNYFKRDFNFFSQRRISFKIFDKLMSDKKWIFYKKNFSLVLLNLIDFDFKKFFMKLMNLKLKFGDNRELSLCFAFEVCKINNYFKYKFVENFNYFNRSLILIRSDTNNL